MERTILRVDHCATLALMLAIAGCTTNAAVGKSHQQLQTELQAIASRCSPDGKLKFELVGTKELRVRPDPSAGFGEVDCFLEAIKPYRFSLGLVGNEAK